MIAGLIPKMHVPMSFSLILGYVVHRLVIIMLNKNTLGVKKLRGQSEAAVKWLYMRPKSLISG